MKIITSFLCISLCLNAENSSVFPNTVNEWQHVDPTNQLIFPWFTKPFLDLFKTWDIKEWTIFEWGAGHSTLWLATRCQHVVSVENNANWIQAVHAGLNERDLTNVVLKHRVPSAPYTIGEGGENSLYVNAINEDNTLYDCIIINGNFHRNACAHAAIKHLKKGGIIILDNASQASVGLNSSSTFELLKAYPHLSFLQPGHPDWRTDCWIYTDENTKILPQENELLKKINYDSLAESEWNDYVLAFRELFNLYPVTSFLEFGVGLGSKFYLENCQQVTSIELVIKDRYSFVIPGYCTATIFWDTNLRLIFCL